jgi:hypothetical protein
MRWVRASRRVRKGKSLWEIKAGRLKLVDLSEQGDIEEGGIGDEAMRCNTVSSFTRGVLEAPGHDVKVRQIV